MLKKNILFILEEGRFGGPQVYLLNLLNFISDNYKCYVIFPKKNSQLTEELFKKNKIHCKSLSIETLSIKKSLIFWYCFYFFRDLYIIKNHIVKTKADGVYIAGGSWQFKSVLAAWFAGRNIIWHLNDTKMNPVILKIFSQLCKFSKNFIYASEKTKIYYSKFISHRVNEIIIPSSVSMKFFEKPTKISEKHDLKVLTTANINPIKGFEMLIEVAELSKINKLPLTFYVVGNVYKTQKDYFNKIMHQVKILNLNNIKFLGGSSDVLKIAKTMDLYLCTSKFESSPIAVWEAMALGIPIISTDVGDVKFYLDKYSAGKIYKNSNEALEYLTKYVYNRKILILNKNAARKCALENFDPKICARDHEKFFDNIL